MITKNGFTEVISTLEGFLLSGVNFREIEGENPKSISNPGSDVDIINFLVVGDVIFFNQNSFSAFII